MRAFVQTAIGAYAERDIPVPRAAPGEVVLRVRAALTCGTDLKLLARGHPRISLPVTMGHEACGEIVEAGEGVADFHAGERVVARGLGALRRVRRLPRRAREPLRLRSRGSDVGRVRGVPARARGGRAVQPAPPAGGSPGRGRGVPRSARLRPAWIGTGSALRRRRRSSSTARERSVFSGLRPREPAESARSSLAAERPASKPPRVTGRVSWTSRASPLPASPPTPPWIAPATRESGSSCRRSCARPAASSSSAAARRAPPSPTTPHVLHYSEISLAGSFHYTPEEARAGHGSPLLGPGRSPSADHGGGLAVGRASVPGSSSARRGIRYAIKMGARVLGFQKGEFTVSENFDEPLPEEIRGAFES